MFNKHHGKYNVNLKLSFFMFVINKCDVKLMSFECVLYTVWIKWMFNKEIVSVRLSRCLISKIIQQILIKFNTGDIYQI
jgi:hypothetical protein